MSHTASISSSVVLALFAAASEVQERDVPKAPQTTQNRASEDDLADAEPVPIVVLGDKEEEEEKVVLGSRIPRKPLFDYKTHSVATSTGTPGFVPQSGMDPSGAGIRRITKSTCEASDSKISRDVACALIAAKSAMEDEDWNLVRGHLVPLAGSNDLSQVEHRAVADYLYISAQTSGIVPNKIEALKILIDTQTLSKSETGNALRSLSSLYLAAGNEKLAVLALEEAVRLNPNDHRALGNLEILKKNDQVSTISQGGTDRP